MRRGSTFMAAAACAAALFGAGAAMAETAPVKTEILTISPDQLAGGIRVYLSKRITASPASANRPPAVDIGTAPQTFHCAISDVVILQTGLQPSRRDGKRACSVYLEDDVWKLRVQNVRMKFTESKNSRVECQAICMELAASEAD